LKVSIDVSFGLIVTPRDFAEPLSGLHMTVCFPAGRETLSDEPLPFALPSTLNVHDPPEAIAKRRPEPPPEEASGFGSSRFVLFGSSRFGGGSLFAVRSGGRRAGSLFVGS